jgi:hypothetical protein
MEYAYENTWSACTGIASESVGGQSPISVLIWMDDRDGIKIIYVLY